MAWTIENPVLGYPSIGDVVSDSDAYVTQPALGTIVRAVDPTYGVGEFIWLDGAASTAAGSWVIYDIDSGATTLLAADAIGPVAVAMGASIADTQGWYQINGAASGTGSTVSIADSADLYATATAGVVGSTVVTGDRIWGAKSAEDSSDGTVLANINRPFVNNAVNAGTS